MARDNIVRDWREEDRVRRDRLDCVRDAGGVLLNNLNHFGFVDGNHVHHAGDLRDFGGGRGVTDSPMPPGQW